MLTDNRFITYMVLIFSDSNKTQIYKMPCTYSPHREIEILKIFIYLNWFQPNDHTEDYHNRGPNNKNFLLEIEVKNYIYVEENLVNFEKTDKIVETFPKKNLK